MNLTYQCGEVEITIDGTSLYVGPEWIGELHAEDCAATFANAMNDYGDAMYAEGYVASGMEAI